MVLTKYKRRAPRPERNYAPLRIRRMTLADRSWDAVVVGAGHNGLTAAAYLARAGPQRARARAPRPGRRRLHARGAVARLRDLAVRVPRRPPAPAGGRGAGAAPPWLRADPAQPGRPVHHGPVHATAPRSPSGSTRSARSRSSAPRTAAATASTPGSTRRIRDALRPDGPDDLWLAEPPSREQIEARLDGDEVAIATLFEDSHTTTLERFFSDRVRRRARRPGRDRDVRLAARPRHRLRQLAPLERAPTGIPGAWTYVRGGMGNVSFALERAAREAGAEVAHRLAGARRSAPARASSSRTAPRSRPARWSATPTRGARWRCSTAARPPPSASTSRRCRCRARC